MSDPTRTWYDALLRPELASMRAYVPVSTGPAIRLDANESPHALPPEATTRLAEELSRVELHRYPDVRAAKLRERIAERSGAHPDEIVIGCGSDEVIAMMLTALATPRVGRARPAALFPEPSFVMFRVSALAQGWEPVAVALDDDWDLDVAASRAAIDEKSPNVIFLPSPNNPTGNLFSRDRIEALIAAAPSSLVILDEAYRPFTASGYRGLRLAHDHVGQLQTLSKLGLAAARVGWAILPKPLAAAVDKVRQPYNLNALSQRAAELCLGELAPYFDRAVDRIVEERTRLAAALATLDGVRVSPSESNFLWVEVPVDAGVLHAALMEKGIVVRSFHASGGRLARRLRITVGTREENEALVAAMRASL
jgi:histidinol-phosphate aminotransferase